MGLPKPSSEPDHLSSQPPCPPCRAASTVQLAMTSHPTGHLVLTEKSEVVTKLFTELSISRALDSFSSEESN